MMKILSRRRILPGVILLAVFAIGAWALWLQRSSTPDVPVIIYLVDTLRADRLGLYGYSKVTSPNLDALAAESVVFDNAYAPAPWTLPSVASLLTSTFPCEHGLLMERKKLSPSSLTLVEQLASAGYVTQGFHENIYVGDLAGLDRGYADLQYDRFGIRHREVSGFLAEHGEAPFFLYLHTIEPHESYSTRPKFIKRFGDVSEDIRKDFQKARWNYHELTATDWIAKRSRGIAQNQWRQEQFMDYFESVEDSIDVLYDASVFWADENLGKVVDMLKMDGIWDRAIFIFISDHGEEINEHGGWFHDQSVYEELIRTPLIIHFPQNEFAGMRVDNVVSLIDIMPTVFEYLGRGELCAGCRGSNLMALLDGSGLQAPGEFSVVSVRMNEMKYYRPWKESRGDVNVAVREDNWKAIWNAEINSIELYDLDADTLEQKNVSGQYPELSARLGAKIDGWLETCLSRQPELDQVEDIDEEAKQQLRSLGYFN